jgi:thiol-disulfide isomerase/thioredoxin
MDVTAMADRRRAWKSGHMVIILLLAAPGVLLLLLRSGYLPHGPATELITAINQPVAVPDFALLDLGGGLQRLSTRRGRIVLINFWATWCAPCRAEMPTLEALYQTYKDRGLEILAVSSDRQGAPLVLPLMMQYRLSFPVLLDPSGEVTRLYGVASLPTTYVLDRAGRLVSVAVGGRDWTQDEARELIVPLIDGREPINRGNAVEATPPPAQPRDHTTRRP